MGRNLLLAATMVGALTLPATGCTGGSADGPGAAGTATSGSPVTPPATGSPSPTPPSPTAPGPPLNQEQLEPALLGHRVLGRGFTTSRVANAPFHTTFKDRAANLGCLRPLDHLDFGVPYERSWAALFRARNDAMSPTITNLVGSAETADDVARTMKSAAATLRDCTGIRTKADGVRLRAAVTYDRKRAAPVVDQQLNIHVIGQMRILESTFPLGLWLSIVRVDRNVAIVSLLDLNRDNLRAQRELAAQSAERLAAVTSGVAPGPMRRVELETSLPG